MFFTKKEGAFDLSSISYKVLIIFKINKLFFFFIIIKHPLEKLDNNENEYC